MAEMNDSKTESQESPAAGHLRHQADTCMVSVVVPVFNAELTLPACVDSILGQTWSNLELILVNDGSTDSTPAICDRYAGQDVRVKVIHQANAGVSKARNTGIKCVQGRYLQFTDADDTMALHMLARMVAEMESAQADLGICGYNLIDSRTGGLIHENVFPAMILDQAGFLQVYHRLYTSFVIQLPGTKLYRIRVILDNDIWFDGQADFGEEFLFNLAVAKCCSRFAIINECLYNYTKPAGDSHLTRRRHEKFYEIEKRLFGDAVSIYEGLSAYAGHIEEMELVYVRILLLGVVSRMADMYGPAQYPAFRRKIREIRADEVLCRRINALRFDYKRDKIFHSLIKRRWYLPLYVYHKMTRVRALSR